ncbi:hypothetical protein GCM10027415_34560 [Humibacter ginsengisoli]
MVASGPAAAAPVPQATISTTTGCDGATVRTPPASVQGNAKELAESLGAPNGKLIQAAARGHYRWLTTMTCKARPDHREVLPSAAQGTSTGGAASGAANPNWAGTVVDNDPNAVYVDMAWDVPTLDVGSALSGPVEYSSIWPGLGGWNGDPGNLAQAGTEQDLNCASGTCFQSNYFWWEFFPQNNQQEITDMSVSPGDHIQVEVYNRGFSGLIGFDICNETTNVCVNPDEVSNSTPPAGHTADFIVERTTEDGSLTTLPDFGTVDLESLYGDSFFAQEDATTDGYFVDMYNGTDQLTSSYAAPDMLYTTEVTFLQGN